MRDLDQLALFHRALAEFCRMGMPLGQAFREVAKDLEGGGLRVEAEAMAAEIEGGAALGDAWRSRAAIFPPVYAAMIEAGAASGDLPGTLEEIARHAAFRADVHSRIRRALVYPVAMLLAMTALSWFLFEFIVPQFGVIFSQITDRNGNPMELPGITRLVLDGSGRGLLILPAALASLLILAFFRRPAEGLTVPVGLRLKVPVIGPLRLRAELHSFTSTMGGLLERGLPGDRALDLSAATVEAPGIRRAVESAAERVRAGSGVAEALREEGLLPPSLLWLVASSERRGEPAAAFREVAAILEERLRRAFDRVLWSILPGFQVLLGFLVALVVMAVFYPILRLQSALM